MAKIKITEKVIELFQYFKSLNFIDLIASIPHYRKIYYQNKEQSFS